MTRASTSPEGPSSRAAPRREPPSVTTLTIDLDGTVGFKAYREHIAETSDLSIARDERRFRLRARVHHLGRAVLTDVRTSSVAYTRSARHVARAAYDHYQIVVNRTANIHYESGRQSATLRPGDIIILDSARTSMAYMRAPDRGLARAPAIFVPRAVMATLLPSSIGDEHFLALQREQPQARLLADHVCQMLKTIDANPAAEVTAAVQDLTGMLAGIFGGGREISPVARQGLRRAALDALKRLVERYIDSPVLSADLICARSGWSRSSVYRLFEVEGGLARYIRQRHLLYAFRELMSGRYPGRRIVDLALAHQFSSEASFNRAFRRAFGIPPGEVRELAARSRAETPAGLRTRASDDAEALHWIMLLGAGTASSSWG